MSAFCNITVAGQRQVDNPKGTDFLPAMIADAGERARRRFFEFFAAEIRNANTRKAYLHAIRDFCQFCTTRGVRLERVTPIVVAAYVEERGKVASKPTVKQALAAIRMLFDYLVLGHVVEANPASSVRGPKYVVRKGKTPVLTAEETRQLFDAINVETISGLRDRALIGVMVYSFARVGAVVHMSVEDYYQNGKRFWFRLHEKGGKHHEVPVHHRAEEFLDAYLAAAGIAGEKGTPLFRALDRHQHLSSRPLNANDVLRMVKRRAQRAGLGDRVCCHTFRATGITCYLRAGGTIDRAAAIAAHESTRTTQLYNRTDDQITLDEVERIVI